MTHAIIYSVLAAVLILAVVAILRSAESRREEEDETNLLQDLWDSAGLTVAERIFDPSDYLWLRDQAGVPRLARTLYHFRRRMALRWLGAVRISFNELLRTPDQVAVEPGSANFGETGPLVRQALRFYSVLTYAWLVVFFFGPYHRLVPALRFLYRVPDVQLQENPVGVSYPHGRY